MAVWKLHSSKKHRALGYYFSLVRRLINPKGPFKKLYYADLYCGDGKCTIAETKVSYLTPTIYSVLRHGGKEGFDVCCFLNDINPENIQKIKINTSEYSGFIEDYSSKDANDYYRDVLKKILSDQFSIIYLDPSNHKELKWDTIKGISEHNSKYNGNIRRPELIINFMVYSMLQTINASKACKSKEAEEKCLSSINESLGTNEWENRAKKYKEEGYVLYYELALLYTFIEQLKKIGYMVPTPIEITSTSKENRVYYLIWAVNEAGYSIVENNMIPSIMSLMEKAQKENKIEVKKIKARKQGNGDITKYFK